MERDLKFSCGINENGVLYVPYREVMEQIEKSYGNGFNDGMAKGSIGNDEEDIRSDERAKVLDEVDKYLRELSDIKSGCGEWIEHHDAELMRRTREQEMNFVERKCKELGIDYIQIYTCNSAD